MIKKFLDNKKKLQQANVRIEDHDACGVGFVASMIVADAVGPGGSFATAFGAQTGIAMLPILLYGTDAHREKYIPGLASGKLVGCYCLTEPDAGSDANSGKTKAELTDDGSHYVLNGQKMWITNGGFADVYIVFAKIEDDKNLTCFIVDKGTPGLSVGEEEKKLGLSSSSTRQVFYDKTIVPSQQILGERNGGFKIAMNSLNVGRIKLCAATTAAAEKVLNISISYALQRKQFNTAIIDYGAIQEKFAHMATKTYASNAA